MNTNERALLLAIHAAGCGGYRQPSNGSRGKLYQARMRELRLMNLGLITIDNRACKLTVDGVMEVYRQGVR